MRKLPTLLLAGLLALGIAGIASAATLNWSGTVVIDMVDFGRGSTGGGGVATVNGSAGGVPAHLGTLRLAASRGHVAGSDINFVTDPEWAGNGIAAVVWEGFQGETGTLGAMSGGAASTGSMATRTMLVRGVAKLCLLNSACNMNLVLPFTAPTTVNGVAGTGVQGFGIGGMVTLGGYGGIRLSVQCGPWTIKTLTVTDHITTTGGGMTFVPLAQNGWAHAPASTTSSTAQPGGMVQLVSPLQTRTNLPLGSNTKVGTTGVFVMEFIPEPGLLLLLGSGVAGLAVLGRKRLRR